MNNNEIIKKEILPRKSFFFNITEKVRIVFSFFYLAGSLFLTFVTPLAVFGILILLAGLYFAIFRWLFRYFFLKNNYYIITNQRIIIAHKSTNKVKKQKQFIQIHQINSEMNSNFFGNIIFGEPEKIFSKNDEPFSIFKRTGINFSEDKYAFLSVENINEIIAVFEELGLKVNKTFY